MKSPFDKIALEAFQRAAACVPAYRELLREAGVRAEEVRTIDDFRRLPFLGKENTFRRFPIEKLCVDGELGRPDSVLTSSGHSGVFAFGLTDEGSTAATTEWIDGLLDMIFGVRSQKTLLVNCLPMGVKVHTSACTLAETSVRADMVIGLVKTFGRHYAQIILVGEAAFVKHLLELGERSGIRWQDHRVHVILGEEPLAENARKYLERLLGITPGREDGGIVCSSMGVGEVGLNLFSEVPPVAPLIALRRALHENEPLRQLVLGALDCVPSIFTYDPNRIYVEFDCNGRLIVTTLDPRLRVPLIRYATGDCGSVLALSSEAQAALEQIGIPKAIFDAIPIVLIDGRGKYATAGDARVYPESVKEGIYLIPELAKLTTSNFRLVSGEASVLARIQLSPGVHPSVEIDDGFSEAIKRYARAPIHVRTEAYEDFVSGMTLDFERKFDYLGP